MLSEVYHYTAGHHLARLPVDPRIGKLLLLAAVTGCLAPALSIAAALSYKSPFISDDAARRAKQGLAAPGLCTEAPSVLQHVLIWRLKGNLVGHSLLQERWSKCDNEIG